MTTYDSLGLAIEAGDIVTVTAWGNNVRLSDVRRTAVVSGFTRAGNVILEDCNGNRSDIANGTAVRGAVLSVNRRDGREGWEGNRRQPTKPDLSPYSDVSFQVWVQTPQGGLYVYRDDLIYSVTRNWADTWNKSTPEDVAKGSRFLLVESTTTFKIV